LQNYREGGDLIFHTYCICSSRQGLSHIISEVRQQFFMTIYKALMSASDSRVISAPQHGFSIARSGI